MVVLDDVDAPVVAEAAKAQGVLVSQVSAAPDPAGDAPRRRPRRRSTAPPTSWRSSSTAERRRASGWRGSRRAGVPRAASWTRLRVAVARVRRRAADATAQQGAQQGDVALVAGRRRAVELADGVSTTTGTPAIDGWASSSRERRDARSSPRRSWCAGPAWSRTRRASRWRAPARAGPGRPRGSSASSVAVIPPGTARSWPAAQAWQVSKQTPTSGWFSSAAR